MLPEFVGDDGLDKGPRHHIRIGILQARVPWMPPLISRPKQGICIGASMNQWTP